MTNTYNVYRNVDDDEALERVNSMTKKVFLSLDWLKLHLAVDKWHGRMIYAQGVGQNILISECSCKGIANVIGEVPQKPWVARVLNPRRYLAAPEAEDLVLVYDMFRADETATAQGIDGLYVTDGRCALFFSKPHQRPLSRDGFATIRGSTVQIASEHDMPPTPYISSSAYPTPPARINGLRAAS